MKAAAILRRTALPFLLLGLPLGVLVLPADSSAQAHEDYVLGLENRLSIRVHVLGEVDAPGEYRVPDNTNVLELISKAGGPTEFANVRSVIIKRDPEADQSYPGARTARRIVKVDIDKYLQSESMEPLPMLQPGDVVAVPRNNMHRWKTIFGMVRDVSVVASAYFLYLRSTN